MFFRACRRIKVIVVTAAVLVSIQACGPDRARMPGVPSPDVPPRLRVQAGGRVIALSLEQYVLGAVLSEVIPAGETGETATTIYEVQSIIARSYASAHLGRHGREGFDLCDKTHCQLYEPNRIQTSRFAPVARKAVAATSGRVLRHGSRIAEALFHSDCGGRTTTPVDAWGGAKLLYLPERADDLPQGTHRAWQFSASSQEWSSILRRDPRTDPGGPLRNLSVARTDSSGRVSEVEISGATLRKVGGNVLRTVVTAARGDRSLMSTRFSVTRTANGFRLEGTGFGHGVGLCQVGAIARARRGDSVAEILAHYYPGAR